MSFFKQLLATGLKRVVLDVIQTETKVTVVISPKQKDEKNPIKPMSISFPTVEELDENFLQIVQTPLEKTAEYFSNISDYEKQLEELTKKKSEEVKTKTESKTTKGKSAAAKKEEAVKEEPVKEEAAPDLFSVSEEITKEETEAIINEAEKIIEEVKPPAPPTPTPTPTPIQEPESEPKVVKAEETISEAVFEEVAEEKEESFFDPGDDDDFEIPSLFS